MPLSLYKMLRTHNIASRKFWSLLLKIVKRGKGEETWKIKRSTLQLVLLNHFEGKQLAITSPWYKSQQFMEPKQAA